MDVESISSCNFPSTTASNFWDFRTKHGEVDFRLLPTSWFKLRPQGREVPKITIRTVEDNSTALTALRMSPGVLSLTPVLITYRGVLLIHAPSEAVSTTTSFVAFIKRICGANIIGATPWSIHGFIGGVKTGMVQ